MTLSRRRFIEVGGLTGLAAAAQLKGWTQSPAAAAQPSPCLLHTGSALAPFAQSFVARIPPGKDAFVTEKYAMELEGILKDWSESLRGSGRDVLSISKYLQPALMASLIDKGEVLPVRTTPPLFTERVAFAAAASLDKEKFGQHLVEYFSSLEKLQVAEFRMSAIDVITPSPLAVRTIVHYNLAGTTQQQHREERVGEWELGWQQDMDGRWSLLGWTAKSEQRSRLVGPGFVDITTACLGANSSLMEQLNHGVDHWRTVLDGAVALDIYGNNGLAVGDYDGNGVDDLYVCQPAGLPNRLYRNRGDGVFEDVTQRAGVGLLDATSSAIFADLRNSGHQDLIVVRTNGPVLFLNNGDGTFRLSPDAFHFAKPPQGSFTAVAVADYNLDGLLDVYFCLYSYYQGLSDYQFPTPYYDAQNGPPNFLFRNRGDGTFADVTAASGMNQSNNRYTLACSWNDYNKDGYPDLYVVNDFGRKVLYRNKGDGTFEDVSKEMGVEDAGEGMSSTWFDYDNDGSDDLYVVNMWEAAGKRVTTQKEFMPAVSEEIKRVYRQDAGGNTLLHNEPGAKAFQDVTEASGTLVGGWNWGSGAFDIDNDGYQELYVANGFISGPNKQDLSSFYWRQIVARSAEMGGRSQGYEEAWSTINESIRSDFSWSGYQRNNLYLNNRDGTFTESAAILGLDCLEDGRAFALLDMDGDGRLEVVVKNRNAPQVRVFHNQMELSGEAIAFTLKGSRCNRDAIGAVVEVIRGDSRQRQTVSAGSGFLSQHTKSLFFGLGSTEGNVRAVVHWPGGGTQEFTDLPAGHRIHIEQGAKSFTSVPFIAHPTHQSSPVDDAEKDLVVSAHTWLVAPLAAPDFTLADTRGVSHTLSEIRKTALLVLFSLSCPSGVEQLHMLERSSRRYQQQGVELLTMLVDEEATSINAAGEFSFLVLISDAQTRGVYNIFRRYLYERRQEMVLPTSFLLNEKGEVIKVYNGVIAAAIPLEDIRSAPNDAATRMARALPFEGTLLGGPFHHNYFTYGVAYLQHDYVAQARQMFEQAVRVNPKHAAAYYNLGLIYLNTDKRDLARANLEKAVELDPADANAWNNLGVISGEQGDYATAREYFEKTLSLRPSHLLAVQNLVKLYVYQQKPGDAERVLQAAIASAPSEAQLHFEMAMFCVGQNDMVRAGREFALVLELQPGNVPALNGYGVILMRQGDSAAAMHNFQECVRLDPDFDRPYLNIAALLLKSGEPQRAVKILDDYHRRHPENKEIASALAELERAK